MKYLLAFLLMLIYACGDGNPYTQGQILYENKCASCHMDDGSGLEKVIPPLANSDYLNKNWENLACLVRQGIEGPIIVNGIEYNQAMAAIPELSATEIANIYNYINYAWNDKTKIMQVLDTRKKIKDCNDVATRVRVE